MRRKPSTGAPELPKEEIPPKFLLCLLSVGYGHYRRRGTGLAIAGRAFPRSESVICPFRAPWPHSAVFPNRLFMKGLSTRRLLASELPTPLGDSGVGDEHLPFNPDRNREGNQVQSRDRRRRTGRPHGRLQTLTSGSSGRCSGKRSRIRRRHLPHGPLQEFPLRYRRPPFLLEIARGRRPLDPSRWLRHARAASLLTHLLSRRVLHVSPEAVRSSVEARRCRSRPLLALVRGSARKPHTKSQDV